MEKDSAEEPTVELHWDEVMRQYQIMSASQEIEQLCSLLAVKVVSLATGVFVLPENIRVVRVEQPGKSVRIGEGTVPLPECSWRVERVMTVPLPENAAAGDRSTTKIIVLGERRKLSAAATLALLTLSKLRIAAAVQQLHL